MSAGHKKNTSMKKLYYPIPASQNEDLHDTPSPSFPKLLWQKASERFALPLLFPFLMLSSILLSLLHG